MDNKFQKVTTIIIGTILCIMGLSVIFEIIGLNLRDFVLLILGVAFLIFGIKKENIFLTNTSVFLIPLGISSLINNYIILFQPFTAITTCVFIMISFFILYFMYKKSIYLYIALLLFVSNAAVLINLLFTNKSEITGYIFWIIGIALLILYILRKNKNQHIHILLAIVCYLFGTISLLAAYQIISSSIYTIAVAVLLLLIGILAILYATNSNKNKE